MFRRKKENEFHEELLFQLKGLIDIEVAPYLDSEKDLELFIEAKNGLDVYIYDKDFAYINQYHMISFMPPNFMFKGSYIDDISLIGHYHSDDLLYLILNFKTEKTAMLKRIDDYIVWKDAYIENTKRVIKQSKVKMD